MEVGPSVLLVEPAAFAAGVAVLRLPVARQRYDIVIFGGGVSAGATVFAGCAPTGWVPLDVLLLAGLGFAGALAGFRARPRLILLAGIACAVAGVGSPALPLALAAIGLVLTSLLVKVEPLVNAAAGALVVQAALRLSRPTAPGLTAVVAALVLVPLFASAARTLRRRHRRILVRVLIGAGAFVWVGGIVGALAGASSVGHLRQGLLVATDAVDRIQPVDGEVRAKSLTAARHDFAGAERALGAWWARPARAVPVVAQHWRVLHAAALTGHELTEAGQRALNAPALSDIRVSDGRVPLDRLAALEPTVADVAARARAARRRLDAARSALLIPALREKLDVQRSRVRGIEKTAEVANRVLPLVPRLLGADGSRRYFLAVQTPVEARGGGGFLGNYGEITAKDGRLQLSRFGRQTELTEAPGRASRTLPGPEDFRARYARFRPENNWSNVNLSPDFPTDAEVIAGLYPQSGGAPIDGVVAIDPSGLAALLSVVGPVSVPSWPTPVTAENALQVLLHDQYEAYDLQTNVQRIDFLGEVAQEAWRRLTSGEVAPVQLIAAVSPVLRTKHLFLSSTHRDEQQLFEDMGAAGKMAPVKGDFVGLVTQNASGNKIDYYLRRELAYDVQLDPATGQLRGSATVTLHNEAPASGASPAFISNEVIPPLPDGTNKLYLSFYTPWELESARVDGNTIEFERATELGRHVYSTAVIIPPKSTVVVELSLSGRLRTRDRYRLDVYRQPMVAPDSITTTLTVQPGLATVQPAWATTSARKQQTASMQLESDVTIEVPLRR